MNGKLFSKMVFYIVGTFIIMFFSFIMLNNFAKDARVFAKPIAATAEIEAPKTKVVEIKEEGNEENKTIKYVRAADAKASNNDFGESLPTPNKAATTSTGGTKIKIEIVNYSGIKNIAEELKITFEASGFVASIVNFKENKNEKTTIIERNNKKAGLEVQRILKAGKIIIAIDPKSKFDVTLKIGDDYKP